MDYFLGLARWSLLVLAAVLCMAVAGFGIAGF